MTQLNVAIDDNVYRAAKQYAEDRGMLLRRVVQDALAEKIERDRVPVIQLREPRP